MDYKVQFLGIKVVTCEVTVNKDSVYLSFSTEDQRKVSTDCTEYKQIAISSTGIHVDVEQNICDFCQQKFNSEDTISRHVSEHFGLKRSIKLPSKFSDFVMW